MYLSFILFGGKNVPQFASTVSNVPMVIAAGISGPLKRF